jgi:thiol-disulfide isomerase/thioredoxin
MRRELWLGTIVAGIFFSALLDWCVPAAWSQDEAKEDAAPQAAADAEQEKDIYAVPDDGTPDELLAFIDQLLSTPLADRSPEGVEAHRAKLIESSVAAATKVMSSDQATPEQAARAAEIKLRVLTVAAQIGNESDAKTLEAFKDELRSDKRTLVRAVILVRELFEQLGQWQQLDDEGRQKWLHSAISYLESSEPGPEQVQLVSSAARLIDQTGDPETAKGLVEKTISIFRNSGDEGTADLADSLDGLARYLNLVGSELQIDGQLLSREPFDWSQYKGKVVLVDFWATWCGPCIAEMPNVVQNYKQYHDKGFEVIGISLDDDAASVQEFVAQNEVRWPILFGHEQDATGWYHPMAVKYGIQAIPAAVLVDQDGKVITKNARGEDLGKNLKQLLGDPLPVEDKEASQTESNEKERGS